MNTSQREQYGCTVHLFIGTGRSLCKFTLMSFIFSIDLWTTQWGLDSLFLFKSVPFSAVAPKLPCGVASKQYQSSSWSHFTSYMVLTQVQRYLFMCYTWKALLNHVLEDLRKTKDPNSSPSQY
jgi:predicted cobalt transporter CbtA